jgi:hypothetical protein
VLEGEQATGEAGSTTAKKKEEFPGFMGDMRPGNSFPQICVVLIPILQKGAILRKITKAV